MMDVNAPDFVLTLQAIIRPPNARVYRCQFMSAGMDAEGMQRILVLDIPVSMLDEIRQIVKVGVE